jgi:hypothetical protein
MDDSGIPLTFQFQLDLLKKRVLPLDHAGGNHPAPRLCLLVARFQRHIKDHGYQWARVLSSQQAERFTAPEMQIGGVGHSESTKRQTAADERIKNLESLRSRLLVRFVI